MKVAHISTFPPTRCGIAEFAGDLVRSLRDVTSYRYRLVYDPASDFGFARTTVTNNRAHLVELATAINSSDVDVVDLQHEFGIWGGSEGEHLLAFLSACKKPIVPTLHTTFGPGNNPKQALILESLCERASLIVVLTETAAENLQILYPKTASKVRIIRHGVPDIEFVGRPRLTGNEVNASKPAFVSPGFFRPDKGGITVLEALASIKTRGVSFECTMVGGVQGQFSGQREYRDDLENRISVLGLENEVRLIEKDFERNELIRYIQEADCGLIAYTNRIHGSSGIIPLILSAGRAVISTPIEYSVHTQKVTKGLVVANGFDVDDFVEKLEELASNIDRWRARLPEIYMETRGWLWQASGSKYRATFREALDVVE